MNGMNNLVKMFSNLPPGIRMVLLLVGFTSVTGLFWYVGGSALHSRKTKLWIAGILIGAVLLFLFFGWLRSLFTRRRSGRLNAALETQGPTRADYAEQERLYREKFRGKLAELKNIGLSVYKLPWFVLIGEPGCGKTASLLHSGLDFPLGKDELPGVGGTRNYNWWFTNEAVILDTAGRIAFHEEGATDKVEWEYFLRLLRTHRPRCPVNGIVIALPAVTLDKQTNQPIGGLLRDTPEERQQKAAILRERLRQMHQALGVRFPTFILVTKMDLVGGFAEFFAEAYGDLAQRNQMFGWSRPGPFQEPYDPGTFPAFFDAVRQRLRHWGLRYLQRRATEQELGMITTFPEAFHELRGPLQDYIGTIFQKSPLLEPPFFRGVYFTSAVQEGAPLLDVFARGRRGRPVMLERTTRAVESRAFFIHDFYEKKVFPEQGLVFRSARHVELNKRKRWLVWAGSSLMGAALLGLFGIGYFGVKDLIVNPRDDCQKAAAALERPAGAENLDENLKLAERIQGHYRAYDRPSAWWYAKALFLAADIREPQKHVGRVHAAFTLRNIIQPVFEASCATLGKADLALSAAPEARRAALAAAEVVCRWLGEATADKPGARLDEAEATRRAAELRTLAAVLDFAPDRLAALEEQFKTALVAAGQNQDDFPRAVLRERIGLDEPATAGAAQAVVDRLTDAWLAAAAIRPDGSDVLARYWAQFQEAISRVRERYVRLLDLGPRFAESDAAAYADARADFERLVGDVDRLGQWDAETRDGSLAQAYNELARLLREREPPQTDERRIIRLGDLLAHFQRQWEAELAPLEAALRVGAPEQEGATRPVYEAIDGARTRLTKHVEDSIQRLRAALDVPKDADPLEHFVAQQLVEYADAGVSDPPAPGQLRLEPGQRALVRISRRALGDDDVLRSYLVELRDEVLTQRESGDEISDLRNWPRLLAGAGKSLPAGAALQRWFGNVEHEQKTQPTADPRPIIERQSRIERRPFWLPLRLYHSTADMLFARRGRNVESLLLELASRAAATTALSELSGAARLMPGFDEQTAALPFDKHRFNAGAAERREEPAVTLAEPTPPAAEPVESPDEDASTRRRRRREEPPAAAVTPPPAGRAVEESGGRRGREPAGWLVRYHQREFLAETLRAAWAALQALKELSATRPGLDPKPAVDALSAAVDAYIDRYFRDWLALHQQPRRLLDVETLELLERCGNGALPWPEYQGFLRDVGGRQSASLAARFASLLREAVFFADEFSKSEGPLEDWVNRRLQRLDAAQESVVDRLSEFIYAKVSDESRAAQELSGRYIGAWGRYTAAITGLQEGAAAPRELPGKALLRGQLESVTPWQRLRPEDFLLTAPLLDLAAYSEELLLHHLESSLASLLNRYRGRYPVGVSRGNELSPAEFVTLLKELDDYRARYGDFLKQAAGTRESYRALLVADEWRQFLFGGGQPALTAQRFSSIPLKVSIEPAPQRGQSVFSIYYKFEVNLPLVLSGQNRIEPILFDYQKQTDKAVFDAMWDLNTPASAAVLARAYERNESPGAQGFPNEVSAPWPSGAGSVWSLLMLPEQAAGSRWRIPIDMTVDAQRKLAYDIYIQWSNPQAVPSGPIPVPSVSSSVPRMTAAERYLKTP